MTALMACQGSHAVRVIIGVDTHQDQHVAVAIDEQGVRLSEHRVAANTQGYAELQRWSRSLGEIRAFGIEGTGSYGAGVTRFLTCRGYAIVEVNRPDRSTRRRKGKSDPTDAEMAARSVLAGVANATPKSGEGKVEMIRMLKKTKDSAVKARTQSINQMKALVVTAPVSFVKRSIVSRPEPLPSGAQASGLVLWAIPPQRPSILSAPSPAATVSSARRPRILRRN